VRRWSCGAGRRCITQPARPINRSRDDRSGSGGSGEPVSDSYRSILDRADAHFASVVTEQPANLSCRLGCTLCCHGLFEIGAADVAVIARGLEELPAGERAEVIARAEAVLAATAHPDLSEASEEEKDAFFEKTSGIPCPALDERGGCRIYAHRPLLCRTFGLTLRDGAEYLGQECELNFTAATAEQKERAAWDLQWEDAVGPEDQFTVPQAIVVAARLIR
jgi:Fe-S-cluster containining protein